MFKALTKAETRAVAEADLRALAEHARELLAGKLTRDRIGSIKNLLDAATNPFWKHDIEEVPAAD